MNVTIDLVKGTTTLKTNEEDSLFTFGAQNQMANEYLGKHHLNKMYNQPGQGNKYRPFEDGDVSMTDISKLDEKSLKSHLNELHSFNFKAAPLPLSLKSKEEEKKSIGGPA